MTNKTCNQKEKTNRRQFLKLGAAASIGGACNLIGPARADSKTRETKTEKDGLYHETDHIRKIYKLARF